MHTLSFSYCFPNSRRPTWGVFVLQRLAAVSRRTDLVIASPVPVFPLWSRLRGGLPAPVEAHGGLTVHYPRWFYVPGVLKTLDARLYARGIRRWVDRQCRRRRPDLLDAHFIWPDGVAVARLARDRGIPYVITLRGGVWVYLKKPGIQSQCLDALQGAAAVISLSDSMTELCRAMGATSTTYRTVHNGVNRDLFFPADRQEARRTLGLPEGVPLVLCVAYFEKRKGILELVQAMARQDERAHLVLVGSQASDEPKYYTDVRQAIARLGLAERVTLAGQQPHARIPSFFQAANVTVLASYWEGCPNAVVESLGCGTPVVATPVGAVPELIRPGVNGEIVRVQDVDSLAEGIRRVLARDWDPGQLSRTVESWDDVAARVHDVWKEALGEGSADAVSRDNS
jgi:glycosyltransferase involved in cell wall biosynthesis